MGWYVETSSGEWEEAEAHVWRLGGFPKQRAGAPDDVRSVCDCGEEWISMWDSEKGKYVPVKRPEFNWHLLSEVG